MRVERKRAPLQSSAQSQMWKRRRTSLRGWLHCINFTIRGRAAGVAGVPASRRSSSSDSRETAAPSSSPPLAPRRSACRGSPLSGPCRLSNPSATSQNIYSPLILSHNIRICTRFVICRKVRLIFGAYFIIISIVLLMLPKPRYLDLQDQLYYPITLHKELVFDNQEDQFHMELFERVAYDTYDRVIDLTLPINHVLTKAYGHQQEYHIYVYDPCVGDFRFLAYFPQENNVTLGEQFLQADTLLFQVRRVPEPAESDEEQVQMSGLDFQDPQEEQGGHGGAAPEEKTKRRKTIREMLEVIKQWRKLYLQYQSKLGVNQGAEMIGISKRTLQFYIHSVKLGEKYEYAFEANIDKKISDLKKFLKLKSQEKKHQEMEMLAQFKHFYK